MFTLLKGPLGRHMRSAAAEALWHAIETSLRTPKLEPSCLDFFMDMCEMQPYSLS